MPSFIVQLIVDRINRFVPVRTRTISRIEKSIFQNSKNRKKKIENPEISRLTIENEKGEKVLWQKLAMDIHHLKRIVCTQGIALQDFLGLQLTPNNLRSNVLFPEFHFL